MSQVVNGSALKTLFTFPFQGQDWRNRFLIGSALLLASLFIPIVPALFVAGYALIILRQAIKGEKLELPPWTEWGKLAVDGLRAGLIALVYLLPGILVIIVGFVIYLVTIFGSIPLAETVGRSGDASIVTFLAMLYGSMGVMFICMAVGMLLLLLGSIPLPVALAHFAIRDNVGAAFRVREWWPLLRANALGYFIAWVVISGLYSILYTAIVIVYYTIVGCCLAPFLSAPIGFFLTVIGAGLFGQTYRESEAILAARKGLAV